MITIINEDCLIGIPSDGSYYEYIKGNFNNFRIIYTSNNGKINVNGIWVLEKLYSLGNRYNKKRLVLNDMMNDISKLDYKDIKLINDIVNKYASKLNETKLFLEKHLYLMISFYCAEDNWKSKDGISTKFGRSMYESEFKRVLILEQKPKYVANLYKSEQLNYINLIKNYIYETEKMIEKLHQKSLLDY